MKKVYWSARWRLY